MMTKKIIKEQLNGCDFLLKAIFGLNFSKYIENDTCFRLIIEYIR